MKTDENGVLHKSSLYFYSPSSTAENLYFYPISAGHYFCNKNYHLIRESFESLLIVYIINGKFNNVQNGKILTAQKGDTVIIDCFNPHEYFVSDYCEFLWVHINGSNCKEFYDEITKSEGNVIKCSDPDHVQKVLERLIDAAGESENISETNLSLDIYKLLLDLSTPLHISVNHNASYAESILDAKKYISEHLNEKLSVEKIASSIHMSPSHFSRIFRQQTGFSPYDYVLITRLNKAKDYLQKTDLSVSEIAFEVGFNSDTGFISFFKQNTGLSPKKFRSLRF